MTATASGSSSPAATTSSGRRASTGTVRPMMSGSNYIVWQEGEYWNGHAYDVETIVEISIDSLPSL